MLIMLFCEETCIKNLGELLGVIKGLGVDYVSLGAIKEEKVTCVFSNLDWQQRYLNCCLYLYDPSFKAAIGLANFPFLWSSITRNTKKSSQVMSLRCEALNVCSGLTININANNKKTNLLLTLGSQIGDQKILEKSRQVIPIAHNFILNLGD
jgi:Autoinducer binding domain